jgi:Ribonucleotide reductase, small chain
MVLDFTHIARSMPVSPIFNPSGDDAIANRSIWFGNTTNLMQLNDVRYTWAVGLYKQMRENFWIPERLDITQDVTDYWNLTDEERRAYDGILSYLTFLDSVQTCNIPHLKESITAPEISLCLGEQISQECFDDKTEILTHTGWKLFSSLTESDLVAQYSLDKQAISLVSPSRFLERDYEGILVSFESGHTSICVTPNHELINIHPVTKVATKRLAKDTKGGNYSYPKTGAFISTGNDIVSVLTKLLIAVAADGTVRVFNKTETVTAHAQMTLSKQRKIDQLERYLQELGISFTKTPREKNQWRYSFTLPIVIEQEDLKSLNFIKPFLLTRASALELLSELVFWDGSRDNFFYSTNKQAADRVQIVAMVAGKNASVGINRTQEQASKTILPQGNTAIAVQTCYVVTISDCQTKTYPTPSSTSYQGKVYCVTVPDGNIVTRRNGKIAITGNCMHNQSYQYIIETIIPPERRSEVYDFWRTDKVLKDRCEFIASLYQKYIDHSSVENYFVALLADYLLEGLYFYNGLN